MKRTTNKVQRDYMAAKALVKTLEEREKEIEQAYIASHGITNPDGSTPERIYCIMDDSVFDKANEETAAEISACGLEAEHNAAKAALEAAEDRMIEYGLSIAPAGIRSTLAKGAKDNYTTRQKLIELVFRLDVSTVPR